jgi:hypothetical protein
MNVFEFARIVELNRELYREFHPHCPLCGCTNVRWKGCDNPWHSLRTSVRSANVGVHTDDPGSCDQQPPGPAKEVEVPPHE